jgi:hypothetical protein
MGASLADLELDDDSDFAERPSLSVVSRVQNRWDLIVPQTLLDRAEGVIE